MANLISQYFTDKFIAPAVEQRLAASVQKDTSAFAVGVLPQPSIDIRSTLGQDPDADYDLLYAIYQAHADVSACVAIWAGSVTGNGWHIGLMDKEAKPTAAQQTRIDELTTWLKNPNPTKRFSRILYELVAHMAITGDAYLNKVTDGKGRIKELWGVHPATMRIVADEHGMIHGYIQRYRGQNVASFKPEEISRFQLPSVVNDLYGHSPLESVLEEVHVDLQALRANRAIFENGFKPSVILMMKDGVKDFAERLKALIQQKHTGASHQHGVMAVSGVEKIEQYSSTLKDMEFVALRTLTTEKVATAYRVPKFMLNQKESADLATSAVQERQFFNGTSKPNQDIFAEVFTEDIIHATDPDLAFYFNEPDFNDADAIRKDALTAEGQGIVTDDEVREHYFSLPKKTPEQRVEEEAARQQMAAQVQPAAPTDPAAPDTSSQQTKPDEQAGTEATTSPKKKPAAKKSMSRQDVEAIRLRREGIHDQLEADVQPDVVRYFERQEQRYLDKLATTFKSTRSAVKKGILDNLVATYFTGTDDDDRELAILLHAELRDSLNQGANEAQLQISFSLSTEAQLKIVDDYLLQNALAHAKGINDTTKSQLTDTLRQGIADGEGIPELRARVKSVFTSATNARATAIARSETAQAFEYANQRAMKESGVVSAKTWLTAKDERTCFQCVPLDGVTVPLDQSFPGGAEPGSIHVSCRCSSIGVVDQTPVGVSPER